MKKDIFFIIALGIILSIGISFYNPWKGGGDFLAYWSAAHLFVHGGNPYNQAEMSSLQYQIDPERFSLSTGLINAWNPPWLILILLPIGLIPYAIAIPIWIFCNTFLIGMALIITWKLCIGDQKSRGILFVYLAGFLFVETLSYLAIGQITSLVLLGIVLFIWLLERDLDILAGIALLLTTIKPHISYFFFLLVFIWIIQNHRWKVFVGFCLTALISLVIFWILIPSWVKDYALLVSSLPYNSVYTSTLGNFISEKFNISIFNFSAVLLIFIVKPLLKLITKDGWLTTTNLALLSSIPLSPFGFNFDQIVILPAIVQIISWSSAHLVPRKSTIFVIISFIFFDLILLIMTSINGLEHYWFFWIPIALLGIYLTVWKKRNASRKFTN